MAFAVAVEREVSHEPHAAAVNLRDELLEVLHGDYYVWGDDPDRSPEIRIIVGPNSQVFLAADVGEPQ